METRCYNVYKFDELTDEQKEKAIQNWRDTNYKTGDYVWMDEILDSYKAVKSIYTSLKNIEGEIYGARLYAWIQNNLSPLWIKRNYISKHKDGKFKNSDWEYKYDCIKYMRSNISFTNNLENCPFTGVCYDFNFLQPIIDFIKKPSTNISNIDLVDEMPSLYDVQQEEIDSQNSVEYIIETIEANDYDFNENGEIA